MFPPGFPSPPKPAGCRRSPQPGGKAIARPPSALFIGQADRMGGMLQDQHRTVLYRRAPLLPCLAEAEKGQDGEHDDDQANKIDDIVHDDPPGFQNSRGLHRRSETGTGSGRKSFRSRCRCRDFLRRAPEPAAGFRRRNKAVPRGLDLFMTALPRLTGTPAAGTLTAEDRAIAASRLEQPQGESFAPDRLSRLS